MNPTVLIVDDEPSIRGLLRQMFCAEGYQVLDAGSPEMALAQAEAHEGPIDLLVSDVMMPGRMGPSLALDLTDRRPDLKAIFISGHLRGSMDAGALSDSSVLVHKPFSVGELLGTARRLLGLLPS